MNKNNYFLIIAVSILILNMTIPTIYAVDSEVDNTGNIINQNYDGVDQKLNSIINRILELVNIERAKYNLNPLTIDQDLNSAAMIRSEDIIHLFEHKRPNGSEITTISSKIYGENIAFGQSTPEQVMAEWMASPTHRANILNSAFTTLGIGYTKVKNDDDRMEHVTYYWVQLFGGIRETKPLNNITSKITPIQVEKLAITSVSHTKITLKWSTQNTVNADGYQVFRYNSKTKSYSLIKNIAGNKINTYTDTGLSPVTRYNYAVRSYLKFDGKVYYAPYSSVVKTTTKPPTPSLNLISKNKKISISWNKVSKASGYKVYRSKTKNGKYSLRKVVKSASKTKLVENRIKRGKYYYKIRSYSIVNKKKLYSTVSSPKSVIVK